MTSRLNTLRTAIADLLVQTSDMFVDLAPESVDFGSRSAAEIKSIRNAANGAFRRNYQAWYTQAHRVIEQLIPVRLDEFESAYRADPRRRALTVETYKIEDWLLGLEAGKWHGLQQFDAKAVLVARFVVQRDILESAATRLDSAVPDIRQVLQADLFDSELEAARELLKKGFLRPAGVLAGVVLERHLSTVCKTHQLTTRKKAPTIADFYELLKGAEVIDLPEWRRLQRLGDLRNLCGHQKDREPTLDEVRELIDGVDATSKTLF